jgi:hypothetical protein
MAVVHWGAVLCLAALGCGAAAPAPVAPSQAQQERGAVRGLRWVPPTADCGADDGCLDWLPQPPADCSLYGYVLDREQRQPVIDAELVAIDAASGRRARAETNGLGQFFFGRLAPGRYLVTVTAGEARDVWPDVVVDAGRRTALRVHIAPQAATKSSTSAIAPRPTNGPPTGT